MVVRLDRSLIRTGFSAAGRAKGEALDTRELARRIAVAKGVDGEDKVLCRAIGLVRTLLLQAETGTILAWEGEWRLWQACPQT